MTDHDELQTIHDIMKGARFASVATRTREGALVSRPLAVLDHDFEGKVWFFTQDPSPKTDDLAGDSHVNVSYADGASHVSLSGTGSVVRDAELIDRFWNPWAEAWFEGGREDPSVALLQVDADTVEYWHVDKPAVVRAFEVAKALLTRTAPDVGESRTVDLGQAESR
jgi:general stress protein 26